LAATVDAVALKVVDADPGWIVTLDGTEIDGLELLIATAVELPAVWLRETVQVLVSLLPSVEGAHDIPVSCAGAVAARPNDCEVPLNDAVI